MSVEEFIRTQRGLKPIVLIVVTDTVVVFPGVTLTIEPGVTIKFNNGKPLEVRGSLNALGTAIDTILFTSNSISPTKGIWGGIKLWYFTNIKWWKVEYGEGVRCGLGSSGGNSVICTNSIFLNNLIGISTYASYGIVDSCYFEGNDNGIISGTSGFFPIANSIFINNSYGVNGVSNVTNSIFCANTTAAIYSFSGILNVSNCIIKNNNIGIDGKTCAFDTITNNTIYYNNVGIKSENLYAPITNNNICKNNQYNLEHNSNSNIDVTNNCWCDADSVSIAAKIYDGYDNLSLGLANFSPYLVCDTTVLPSGNPCSGIISGISSTVKAQDKNQITISPNPFTSSATLTISHPELVSGSQEMLKQVQHDVVFVMFDLLGREVYYSTFRTPHSEIHRGNLPAGMYFYKLTDSGEILATGKVVIQ